VIIWTLRLSENLTAHAIRTAWTSLQSHMANVLVTAWFALLPDGVWPCSWVATWGAVTTSERRYETFNSLKYGFEQAKELAIAARKAAEERGEARLQRRQSVPGSAAHQSAVKGGHLSVLAYFTGGIHCIQLAYFSLLVRTLSSVLAGGVVAQLEARALASSLTNSSIQFNDR
jgi:hypothetical protein